MSAKNLSALGVLYTDRRQFYVSPNMVKELWTDVTPFTTILSNREIRGVPDPDFKMFEHRAGWIEQKFSYNDASPASWPTNGSAGEEISGITIDGLTGITSSIDSSMIGLVCEIWDSTLATYKGQVLITDVVAATSLTIKALGNPRATNGRMTALADDDVFYVVDNAFGEGTEAPEAFSDELEVVYNSTQIFKTSVEVTGTLYEAALRGYSSELERLRIDKFRTHKMQIERGLLLGTRPGGTGMTDLADDNTNSDSHTGHQTDKDGKYVRTTMGIIPAIYRYGTSDSTNDKQNIFTISAASYKYSNFVDDMEKVFQYIPETGSKIALCGSTALSYWSKVDDTTGFAKKSGFSVQLDSLSRSELGFDFRRLITPHGQLELVYAPALRGPYKNVMLVIDPANLFVAQYRPQKFMANVKTDNAYDGVKDLWQSDMGLGVTLIEKHSIFNITA